MPRLKRFKWAAWADEAWEDYLWATKGGTELLPVAVDTETSGVAYHDEPFCATITWRDHRGLRSYYLALEPGPVLAGLGPLMEILSLAPVWVFHNAKFDLQKLLLVGALPEYWQEKTIHDTQLIFHLLNENAPKGLKALAVSVLKEQDTIEVEIKSGPNKGALRRVPREQYELRKVRSKLGLKATDGYHLLPREVVVPYALKDTEFTLRLFETLWPALARVGAQDPALMRLYHTECELMKVLLEMEAHGMGVDVAYVDAKVGEYGVRVMEGLGRVADLAGKDDPKLPNSPKQLKEVFAELGEDLEATSEVILRQLVSSGRNPAATELALVILNLRSDSKIYKTYLKAIQNETREATYHPNFNPIAAKTGRMSSGTAAN